MNIPYFKSTFRVDYQPTLDFYSKLYPLAASIDGYPDWSTTGLNVRLRNFKSNCTLYVGHTSFSYDRDLKGVPSEDDPRIREATRIVTDALEKRKYKRLGLRRKYLWGVEMPFEDLVDLVSEKLLAQNEEVKRGICPKPTDVAYIVNFSEEAGDVHLKVGPVQREELENWLEPLREDNFRPELRSLPGTEMYATCPQVSLLIDVDYSKEDLDKKDLITTFEAGLKVHDKVSQNIIKYIFGFKG